MAIAEAVLRTHARHRHCLLTRWVRKATASRALMAGAGVPTYETPEDAVCGFMHLVRWQRSRAQLTQTPPSIPDRFRPDKAAADWVIDSVRATGRRLLMGPKSRAIFASYDIPLQAERIARDPTAAAELGQAVALKILSPDISHKSHVGEVAVELETPAEVATAAEHMLARVTAGLPASIDAVDPDQGTFRWIDHAICARQRRQQAIAG
jgi:acetyltransferase